MERIPEIDGLRALAALLVFAHHIFGFLWIARFTGAGWVGVDLFFVISGYLITTILMQMRGSPHYFRNFYMRRTLRIFPPYYFLLMLSFSVATLTNYHFSRRLWMAFLFYGTSVVALLPWFPGAIARLPGPVRAMEVTWSLSIEELFYVLWAPAVCFLRRRQLILLVLGVIIAAPIVRWYVLPIGHFAEIYSFPARMDGLGFGALLALWQSSRMRTAVPNWTLFAAVAASAGWLFGLSDPQSNRWFALLGYSTIAITMCLVLGFVLDHASSEKLLCRALRSQWLVRVGTVSYMFYLLHAFVIKVFRVVFANIMVSHWVLNRTLQVAGSLATTLLLAKLSWKYFESPILSLKSRFALTPEGDEPSRDVHGLREFSVVGSERSAEAEV